MVGNMSVAYPSTYYVCRAGPWHLSLFFESAYARFGHLPSDVASVAESLFGVFFYADHSRGVEESEIVVFCQNGRGKATAGGALSERGKSNCDVGNLWEAEIDLHYAECTL